MSNLSDNGEHVRNLQVIGATAQGCLSAKYDSSRYSLMVLFTAQDASQRLVASLRSSSFLRFPTVSSGCRHGIQRKVWEHSLPRSVTPISPQSTQTGKIARFTVNNPFLVINCDKRCLIQASQVQATIAMDREQAQSHESKDIPTAKPLDFEVTLPDMSKVSRKPAADWCSPDQGYQHKSKLNSRKARSV